MRDLSAMFHGDANIRKTQSWRVINTIANHCDNAPFPLQLLNNRGLICRQHIGNISAQTKFLTHGLGDRTVIASQHNGVFNTQIMQPAND